MNETPPNTAARDSAAIPTAGTGEKKAKKEGSFLRFLLTLALIAWAFRSFVFAPFSIPSGSMLPTLYIGDYLLVSKWPYGYSTYSFPFDFPSFAGRIPDGAPKRGDVVVFRHPNGSADVIKRVIGVAGDTVAVDNGRVILNGKLLARTDGGAIAIPVSLNSPCASGLPTRTTQGTADGKPVCLYPSFTETLPGGPSYTTLDQIDGGVADNYAQVTVPEGHIFLLGDNRDNSLDSRFGPAEGGIGAVPVANVIGRAELTFWSTDGSSALVNPISWFTALRANRLGNGYTLDRQ